MDRAVNPRRQQRQLGRILATAPQLKTPGVLTGGNDLKDFTGPCIVVNCDIQQLPQLCSDFVNSVTNHINDNHVELIH
jgi:hypothetical protein